MQLMSSTAKSITLTLLIIPLILLSACAQKTEDNAPQLQIIDHTLSSHSFGDVLQSVVAVDGKAKNVSNTTINAAVITVNFYDKYNNRLHTTSAVKNNLAAGELWHFNIQFVSPDAWKTTRYDVAATTK